MVKASNAYQKEKVKVANVMLMPFYVHHSSIRNGRVESPETLDNPIPSTEHEILSL